MHKKVLPILAALVLTVCMVTPVDSTPTYEYSDGPAPVENEITNDISQDAQDGNLSETETPQAPQTVSAWFYVLKRDIASNLNNDDDSTIHTFVGTGQILLPDDFPVHDLRTVREHLIDVPDPTNIDLRENEGILWFSIHSFADKNEWWVMGNIINNDISVDDHQPTPSPTPLPTPTPSPIPLKPPVQAKFYVAMRKEDAPNNNNQYYTLIGTGQIITPNTQPLTDSLLIKNSLMVVPNLSSAKLRENEEISWFMIHLYADKNEWWVMGDIVEKNDIIQIPDEFPLEEAPPPLNRMQLGQDEPDGETKAFFYVLHPNRDEKYRASNVISYYTFIGTGTIHKPMEGIWEGGEQALTNITSKPNTSQLGMTDTEIIDWYRIKYDNAADEWRVFGQIIETKPIIPPTIELLPTPTPTKEPETLRELMYHWLITGNSDMHDISMFKLTLNQVNEIYLAMLNNEGFLAYRCNLILSYTTTKNGTIITSFQYQNISPKFVEHYTLSRAAVDQFLNMTDAYMSDIDKVLLAHEFITSRTSYQAKDEHANSAVGPLAYGYGVCSGYSYALNVILHEMGIESLRINCAPMNHGWNIVKLDGNWYHIDSTWDNTKSPNRGTDIWHSFFLRSDNEFKNDPISNNRHHSWDTGFIQYPKAEKPYMSNWFVHSYVGKMYYEKGGWYYIHDRNIVRSKIDGSKREVLVEAKPGETLKITNQVNGGFIYTVNGKTMYYVTDELMPLASISPPLPPSRDQGLPTAPLVAMIISLISISFSVVYLVWDKRRAYA